MSPADALHSDAPGAPRLGVDLGGTKIEVAALAVDGRELWRRRVATPQGDYASTLRAIAGLVGAAEDALAVARGTCTIGVGTPGTHSRANGRMRNANSQWLNGRMLRDDLTATLGRAVTVANDANCFALSEAVDGAGRGAEIVFGVILGTGVGGGLVVHGRVLEGANGIAGEWGHNPLPWPRDEERPGPACYCGRSGCIETFLSGPALRCDHARHTGATLDPREIAARSSSGEDACAATLSRYESRLARALAHVVNIVDPDVVVLGGGLSGIDRLYVNVPRQWGAWIFSDRVDTRLARPVHGDASGVRGAAWIGTR